MIQEKKLYVHAPDAYLLEWTKKNLPDAKSYWINDVDMIIRAKSGNIAIVEIKRFKAPMSTNQSVTYQILDYALKAVDSTRIPVFISNEKQINIEVKYKGFYIIHFEKTSFEDGKVYLNYKESSEQEIINLLSFKK